MVKEIDESAGLVLKVLMLPWVVAVYVGPHALDLITSYRLVQSSPP